MNLLNKTGLTYFWGKLKAYFVKGNARLYFGTCNTAAATSAKEVSCSSFTSSELSSGAAIIVDFTIANSATESDLTMNVNNTGAFPIKKVYNGEYKSLSVTGEIEQGPHLLMLRYLGEGNSGNCWVLIGVDYNNTYSSMSQAELDAGTSTTGRRITPKLLRDNIYTKTEVNTLMGEKKIWAGTQAAYNQLTPDSDTLYFITESS